MITTRIYLPDKHALTFYHEKATAEFWDKHWQIDDLRRYLQAFTFSNDGLFITAVKHFLPVGSTILEGGCGRGQLVNALHNQGYRVIGVDFASVTVAKINQVMPELDVRVGDIRNLQLEDTTLDGYISAGVIEHFWGGYAQILAEMQRTIKFGGFLFITFPYMSPLRRFKARLGCYPRCVSQELDCQQENIYQFAFPLESVQHDLEQMGFVLYQCQTFGGIKGLKDEISWLKPWLQPIFDGKRGQRYAHFLDRLFRPFASHVALLVMQKV